MSRSGFGKPNIIIFDIQANGDLGSALTYLTALKFAGRWKVLNQVAERDNGFKIIDQTHLSKVGQKLLHIGHTNRFIAQSQ